MLQEGREARSVSCQPSRLLHWQREPLCKLAEEKYFQGPTPVLQSMEQKGGTLAGWLSWVVLSQYGKVVGSIPSHSTYKNQPVNT